MSAEKRLFDLTETYESESDYEFSSDSSQSEMDDSDYENNSYEKAKKKYEKYTIKYRKYKKIYHKMLSRRNSEFRVDISIVGTEKEAFNVFEKKLSIETNEGIMNTYFDDISRDKIQGSIITYNPDDEKSRVEKDEQIQIAKDLDLPWIVLSLNEKMESMRQNYHHIENVYEYQTPLLDLLSMICNIKLKGI